MCIYLGYNETCAYQPRAALRQELPCSPNQQLHHALLSQQGLSTALVPVSRLELDARKTPAPPHTWPDTRAQQAREAFHSPTTRADRSACRAARWSSGSKGFRMCCNHVPSQLQHACTHATHTHPSLCHQPARGCKVLHFSCCCRHAPPSSAEACCDMPIAHCVLGHVTSTSTSSPSARSLWPNPVEPCVLTACVVT